MYAAILSDKDLQAAVGAFAAMPPERLMPHRRDAADALFTASLRGFHRDAEKMIRAHAEAFNGYFFDRNAFPVGAMAALYAGQPAECIYLVHTLAATEKVDDRVSYQKNIGYALQDMPGNFKGWRGQAMKQSIAVAERLGNDAFVWEAQKYRNAQKMRRPLAAPDYPGTVAFLASRRRPQP